jgi:hypothetical protein
MRQDVGTGAPGALVPGSPEMLRQIADFDAEQERHAQVLAARRTAEEAASPAGRSASALERLADAAERIVELLSPA